MSSYYIAGTETEKGKEMNNKAKSMLAFSAALIAIMLAGTMDFNEAVAEEEHYCEMVEAGAWPAYKGGCEK